MKIVDNKKVADTNDIAIINRIQNDNNKNEFLYYLSVCDKDDLNKILAISEKSRIQSIKAINKHINKFNDSLNFYDNLLDIMCHLKDLGFTDDKIVKSWEVKSEKM